MSNQRPLGQPDLVCSIISARMRKSAADSFRPARSSSSATARSRAASHILRPADMPFIVPPDVLTRSFPDLSSVAQGCPRLRPALRAPATYACVARLCATAFTLRGNGNFGAIGAETLRHLGAHPVRSN